MVEEQLRQQAACSERNRVARLLHPRGKIQPVARGSLTVRPAATADPSQPFGPELEIELLAFGARLRCRLLDRLSPVVRLDDDVQERSHKTRRGAFDRHRAKLDTEEASDR